ncbi:TonB-dependent receptor [Phnomibacter sp. MR]|uniref:TonB-dependent receptor n=1 Tax=Phnomibacter sp. MR TaxID=3042318 RepID=UPI003A7FD230
MRKILFMFFLLVAVAPAIIAQATYKGKVTDKKSGQPLSGATVSLKGTTNAVATDANGEFILITEKSGTHTLVASYIGYADLSVTGDATYIRFELSESTGMGDEVVVTASRRPQKITEAPASVSVITAKDFEQSASFNIGELASKIQGVEFVRTGVNGVGFNARGFNNAFNAKVLLMTDGRNSMMAGGSGLAAGIMNTIIKEDVERLEVVLGPSSALYGPNAHNGIANTITKDPRKHQGTTVVLGGGTQEVFSGRFRQATKINNKWAYKITGEYTAGLDFAFQDSIYAGGSVYGPAVAIPEKNDRRFRHVRGEGHLYYSVTPKSDIIVSYGGSTNRFLSVNNVGRNQIVDWKFSYLQARYVSPRFFAQIYNTWTNVGNSYGIPGYTRDFWNRTHSTITDPTNPLFPAVGRLFPDEAEAFALRLGNRFKEESKRLNAEAQYNYEFEKIGLQLVAGLNYQKDNPNTFGTSLADATQKIEVSQFGGALQLEQKLPAGFKLYAAARVDNHSVFGNLFAPKMGLVKSVPGGAFRVTYGRANAAPIILFQSASVFGLVFGNGDGVRYVPNGAQLSSVSVTEKLKVEEIGTWEIGYKGKIGKKLYVDVNGYYGNSTNFLSPAITVGGRALSVGNIPIPTAGLLLPGAVNAQTGVLSGAAFSTYFNYGEVSSYGVDLGINYFFSDMVSLAVKYSWFGSDITKDNIKNDANRDGFVSAEEKSLNAPKNRIAGTLSFSNLAKGKMFVNLSARWVQEHDFYSGSQMGTAAGKGMRGMVYGGINPLNNQPRFYAKNFNWGALGGFTTIDISAGYRFNSMFSLGAGVSNLFDVEMREFVGSPSIGRLISAELKVHIPNGSKK